MKAARQAQRTSRLKGSALDQHVRDTALQLYADVGWPGFSLDRVAQRAKVDKAALYVRWSSKETLLDSALEHSPLNLSHGLDTGSLRGDLLELGGRWMSGFLTPAGRVCLRIYAESSSQSERFIRSQERMFAERIQAARAIVRRARERGELSEDISTTLVIDLIVGSVVGHVLATPMALHETMRTQASQYIAQLVDFVLLGIQAKRAALGGKAVVPAAPREPVEPHEPVEPVTPQRTARTPKAVASAPPREPARARQKSGGTRTPRS